MNSTKQHVAQRHIIRWLLYASRPVLKPLLLSALCRILHILIGAGIIAIGGWSVVTAALEPHRLAHVWVPIGIMAGLSVLKGLLHYAEQFLGHWVAFHALELLRTQVFSELIPRSPAIVRTTGSGDVLTRITTDIDRIEVFFAHTLVPMVASIVVPGTILIVCGEVVSWPAAAVAALIMVAAVSAFLIIGWNAAGTASNVELQHQGEVSQQVSDTIQGMTEVVAYDASSSRLTELIQLQSQVAKAKTKLSLLLGFRRLMGQAGMLATVIIPAFVAYHSSTGTHLVDPALIAAMALALWRAWDAVAGVEDFSTALHHSLQAASRIMELTKAPPATTDGPKTLELNSPPRIVWENVSFSHTGDAPTISHFSAVATPGSWTALVGATGSGKSTATNLLLRYWEPSHGRITINGQDVREFSVSSVRTAAAVVAQHSQLFHGSVADNLLLAAPTATAEQMHEALAVAQLDHDIELDTHIGESGSKLSGGQRQRLCLARALVQHTAQGNGPQLLILDEFTSHLDQALAQNVRSAVRKLCPDATVIEVTHTLDHLGELVDYVIMLDRGHIIESGTPHELLANKDSQLRKLEHF